METAVSDTQMAIPDVARGRTRAFNQTTGSGSRSVSLTCGKRRIKFILREAGENLKKGIKPNVQRAKRSSQRLKQAKDKRKTRLGTQRKPAINSNAIKPQNQDTTRVRDDFMLKTTDKLVNQVVELIKLTGDLKNVILELKTEISDLKANTCSNGAKLNDLELKVIDCIFV